MSDRDANAFLIRLVTDAISERIMINFPTVVFPVVMSTRSP